MDNPLMAKLSGFVELDSDDHSLLDCWCADAVAVPAGRHLAREGEKPTNFCIVLEGWACRYKLLADGTRQIVGLMLPGDTCDLHGSVLRRADHSIVMLTAGRVAFVPTTIVEQATEQRARIMRALWWCMLTDASIARAWLANGGRRQARARVGHLLCELWVRASEVGLTSSGQLTMPLSQIDLADALALTSVHVNRTLRRMQEDGLVRYDRREFTIPDLNRLAAEAGFDPIYLRSGAKRGR